MRRIVYLLLSMQFASSFAVANDGLSWDVVKPPGSASLYDVIMAEKRASQASLVARFAPEVPRSSPSGSSTWGIVKPVGEPSLYDVIMAEKRASQASLTPRLAPEVSRSSPSGSSTWGIVKPAGEPSLYDVIMAEKKAGQASLTPRLASWTPRLAPAEAARSSPSGSSTWGIVKPVGEPSLYDVIVAEKKAGQASLTPRLISGVTQGSLANGEVTQSQESNYRKLSNIADQAGLAIDTIELADGIASALAKPAMKIAPVAEAAGD